MPSIKKNIKLDLELLSIVRNFFDVQTDQEAVNLALAFVTKEDEIIKTHENLAGTVKIKTPFE